MPMRRWALFLIARLIFKPATTLFFSPKGWEFSAWGNAPGEARGAVPIRA